MPHAAARRRRHTARQAQGDTGRTVAALAYAERVSDVPFRGGPASAAVRLARPRRNFGRANAAHRVGARRFGNPRGVRAPEAPRSARRSGSADASVLRGALDAAHVRRADLVAPLHVRIRICGRAQPPGRTRADSAARHLAVGACAGIPNDHGHGIHRALPRQPARTGVCVDLRDLHRARSGT